MWWSILKVFFKETKKQFIYAPSQIIECLARDPFSLELEALLSEMLCGALSVRSDSSWTETWPGSSHSPRWTPARPSRSRWPFDSYSACFHVWKGILNGLKGSYLKFSFEYVEKGFGSYFVGKCKKKEIHFDFISLYCQSSIKEHSINTIRMVHSHSGKSSPGPSALLQRQDIQYKTYDRIQVI